MKQSSMQYSFIPRQAPGILLHEALPLQLLTFINRGQARNSDGQHQLRRAPITEGLTLESMFAS